jgi:hypothetical protein
MCRASWWAAIARDPVTGLPDSVNGVWSLWEIGLAAQGASRKRFLPVFINDEGRPFVPTAKRVWDLLLTETVSVQSVADAEDSMRVGSRHRLPWPGAQGEPMFAVLAEEHRPHQGRAGSRHLRFRCA